MEGPALGTRRAASPPRGARRRRRSRDPRGPSTRARRAPARARRWCPRARRARSPCHRRRPWAAPGSSRHQLGGIERQQVGHHRAVVEEAASRCWRPRRGRRHRLQLERGRGRATRRRARLHEHEAFVATRARPGQRADDVGGAVQGEGEHGAAGCRHTARLCGAASRSSCRRSTLSDATSCSRAVVAVEGPATCGWRRSTLQPFPILAPVFTGTYSVSHLSCCSCLLHPVSWGVE